MLHLHIFNNEMAFGTSQIWKLCGPISKKIKFLGIPENTWTLVARWWLEELVYFTKMFFTCNYCWDRGLIFAYIMWIYKYTQKYRHRDGTRSPGVHPPPNFNSRHSWFMASLISIHLSLMHYFEANLRHIICKYCNMHSQQDYFFPKPKSQFHHHI